MKKAKLQIEDQTHELSIINGTENEQAIDITKLRAESNFITYDPSYANTGSCISNITYIDTAVNIGYAVKVELYGTWS